MASYHKVEVSLNTNAVQVGIPSPQSVTVTVPTVGPVGPQGPAGPKGDPGEVSGSIAWDNVTDKPSTFTPSSHTHVAADITDFTAAVEAVSPPADWDTLANKPASFTPSLHSSSHHTGGTDQLLPENIGAQTIFTSTTLAISTNTTLTAARAVNYSVVNGENNVVITLPTTGHQIGDIVVIRRTSGLGTVNVTWGAGGQSVALGAQYRFIATGTGATNWSLVAVDTHTHPSTQITGLGTAATQDSTAFAPATGISPSAITGTAVVDSDARLSDSRTPSSHSSSHASAGSDPLAPSDIGAQSIFVTESLVLSTSAERTLTAARAKILDVLNFSGSDVDVVLPQTGNQVGDTFVFRWASGSNQILVRGVSAGSPVISLTSGEQKRVIRGTSNWSVIPVDTHTHAASAITSGTLDIARLPTGTGSTQVALGNHTHTQLHDRSHAITSTSDHTAGNHKVFYSDGSGQVQELALGSSGTVLTSNGATSAPSFAAASGGGVTGAASSASDVLGVSGSDITGVDANADRIVFWDDSASKLTYLEAGSGLTISGTVMTASGGASINQAIAVGFVLN